MGDKSGRETKDAKKKRKVFPDDYFRYDKEDAYKIISSMHEHIREAYKLGLGIKPDRPFQRVLVAGMGGSGIAGDLLKELFEAEPTCPVAVDTVKNYQTPTGIDDNTLLIAISYSGNTEETLSMYKTGIRKGCQALLVSSGGKMEELAKLNKHAIIKLPKGLQPRMAIAYLFFPILRVMENSGVVRSYEQEVNGLVDTLKQQDIREKAIELSAKCYEKIPLILADNSFYPVAYRWKTQVNENAKAPAFCHALPEFNHNEMLAYTNRIGSYYAVMLSTDREHRRVIKRIGLTKELLQHKGVAVTEIAVKGTMLKQMFTTIHLGDMTSYFLALRYETDPTPVKLIERFKRDMGPFLI
ncbi:bifunctional phosphoglucose/phosphomannose isomerase [Candidatus Woesearchaeota archaeon]|nr:bifunctional phosphoglucose/phosphomannose isomerase [Candidatus Woesearchaeota archaeon]